MSIAVLTLLLVGQDLQGSIEYQRARKEQLEQFNEMEAEGEVESEVIQEVPTTDDIPQRAKLIRTYEKKEESASEKIMPERPSAPAITAESTSEESQEHSDAYFHKLKRAFPCFKEYLKGMFSARNAMTDNVVACHQTGTEACVSGAAKDNAAKTMTLKQQFDLCLMKD